MEKYGDSHLSILSPSSYPPGSREVESILVSLDVHLCNEKKIITQSFLIRCVAFEIFQLIQINRSHCMFIPRKPVPICWYLIIDSSVLRNITAISNRTIFDRQSRVLLRICYSLYKQLGKWWSTTLSVLVM